MGKDNIKVNVAKCTECTACQLICSFAYTGAFNPEDSCLIIDPPEEIRFTENCRAGCILCTRYCHFGALTQIREV